ncbi:TPA: fibrillarin-like rRNA/tRNA 2'-O-methyltransferase [Candidatus Woesearchaeota archaeon]|nr:MAG: Fibrillarin-like protein rRNA/tRNA 2'-O-methyltransferase [archaeon GW2011_AR11]MBS3111254.1 fibrillarin-like rRNA/tRNA 2'-O-methyltransferase [Candidatus Woesearchaeota archaeon]HIH05494.1 fibrillarin-like rRNA/tRNA 2'-O-methyltransferase [Candidatus Woesearchaeota archaeon]HIH91491.1 fibrillarin-like rRNA/tRNA 2'-O-methyltransferase [Candidatus Woesearchaeota archaeon]HII64548.1 fibrillarin-like rRNA/tRNA 2'-O-methyltransferase [Candidatus Woesearchaeota archaeon]
MTITPSRIFEVHEAQDGRKRRLYTLNAVPGTAVYGEMLIPTPRGEFREWNAGKSKLASYILKGAQGIGMRKGSSVLYLGCATGTTVSHVSDIIGEEGMVFAVDISPIVMRDMLFLAEKRGNIIPILENAFHVDRLAKRISAADVLFQDVAQRNQVEIFLRNADLFLKDRGYGLLAVKARSIDVAAKPRDIFKAVRKQLEAKMTIIDYRELDPFQKDHCMFMVKK